MTNAADSLPVSDADVLAGLACGTCRTRSCISMRGYRCPEKPIEVAVEKFEAFEKAFKRLVSRARRLGCELPVFEVVTTYSVLHWSRDAFDKRWISGATEVQAIRVAGPRLKFAGWSLLATLEPIETKNDAGEIVWENLIKSVPGAGELPAELRAGRQCDHCNKIRSRSETFVVRHEDGRIMRVGRQCIGDFLGGASPENVALRFALAIDCASFGASSEDEEGGGGWGSGRPTSWPLAFYLGLVIREIGANGWLSRTSAKALDGVAATADRALGRLHGDKHARLPEPPQVPTEEELAAAAKAVAWACSVEPRSDYDHNVRAIARSGAVNGKTMGIGASIFGAYERSEAREVERRRLAAARPESKHVGTVGERIEATLTVERIFDTESEWGATHIHLFADDAGNMVKWFASAERLEIGERYHVRGTVKKHADWKGRAETVLSRCAATPIAEWEELQARLAAEKAEKTAAKAAARAAKAAARAADKKKTAR